MSRRIEWIPLLARRPSPFGIWALALTGLLAIGSAVHFGAALSTGFTSHVPARHMERVGSAQGAPAAEQTPMAPDVDYTSWVVARNARTLLSRPLEFFQAEKCFPAESSLAYGEHALALSLLAVPIHVFVDDPVAVFNLTLLIYVWFSGFAVFALVAGWTREPAAGAIAGLLFALNIYRLDPSHLFIHDYGWMALGLLWVERAVRSGSTRDVTLASVCCALQIATCLYANIAAILIALPTVAWLILRKCENRLRPAAIALALLPILVTAAIIYLPYLELRGQGSELEDRSFFFFLSWSALLPSGLLFPGWIAILLAGSGFAMARRGAPRGIPGDPRWALVIGAAFALYFAANGNWSARFLAASPPIALPAPYTALAAWIPGLASVRSPAMIAGVLCFVMSVLAGLGAAACMRPLRSWHRAAFISIAIAAALVGTVRPQWLGSEWITRYRAIRVAPEPHRLSFFRELEARGNRGPVLELPLRNTGTGSLREQLRRVTLTNYHHRPTSGCVGSYLPSDQEALVNMGIHIQRSQHLEALRKMGFTTIVVHHPANRANHPARTLVQKLLAVSQSGGETICLLVRQERMTAFEITGRDAEQGRCSQPPDPQVQEEL